MISKYRRDLVGCANDGEFWQKLSRGNGNANDDMTTYLSRLGFTGEPADMFRSWAGSLGSGHWKDNIRNCPINNLSLINQGNLTFFKEYNKGRAGVNADYSVGSGTATFTATRAADAPATYVDASGVIQLVTTSDVPRFQGGYYDATGFHSQKGLMIERASTNLIAYSYTMQDATWTATNVTVADGGISAPDGSDNASTLTATAANGTVLLTANATGATYSVWLKRKTGTGTINITANSGTTWVAVTLGTDWRRFQVSATSAAQKAGIRIVTDTDAIYAWGNQFENLPYATSFIPTTTAALTRGAEVLKYAISGNRTAATESIFIKFASSHTFAADGAYPTLFDNESGDERRAIYSNNNTVLFVRPRIGDSTNTSITTGITLNTSYVLGVTCNYTGNPNASAYLNGTAEGSPSTTDFTANTFGTNFFIGSTAAGATQLDGVFQAIGIFSDVKDQTAVTAITAAMS